MNANVDSKILERLKKLLALAADKRGNEHMAQMAAEKAAELMEEHGLDTMTIEAAGGEGEKRTKETGGAAFFNFQVDLMAAVAETCFVYSAEQREGKHRTGFTLIGRESAVAGARVLFDYLNATILRLSKEAGAEVPKWYRRGCAERLGERLRARHAERLAAQRKEAEAAQRAAAERAAANGASTGTAVALVLEDYAQAERDLNEDMRQGLPAGTTGRRRLEQRLRREARDALYEKLCGEGLDSNVAWKVAYLGQTRDEAESQRAAEIARRDAADANKKEETETQRRKREEKENRDNRRYWDRHRRENDKRSSSSWRAGRADGENVGLDQQVGRGSKQGRLT